MTALTVTIRTDQVQGLAERLGRVTGQQLGISARDAVNEVTTRFDEKVRSGENTDLNLSAAYIKSKTDVVLSTSIVNPRAEIVTSGDLTILGRYQPLVQLRLASTRAGHTGPRRGRAAGVSVAIRKSRTENQPRWFTMRLRVGAQPGAETGVFVRRAGDNKPVHIYGPSPYSLFRHQIGVRQDDLEQDLTQTAIAKIGAAIEGALT